MTGLNINNIVTVNTNGKALIIVDTNNNKTIINYPTNEDAEITFNRIINAHSTIPFLTW